MKSVFLILIVGALVLPSTWGHAQSSQQPAQVQFDAACEAAREQRLAPERENYINECVSKKFREGRQACESFYSDYGAQTADRPALYYDLPECVQAFEFRNSQNLK